MFPQRLSCLFKVYLFTSLIVTQAYNLFLWYFLEENVVYIILFLPDYAMCVYKACNVYGYYHYVGNSVTAPDTSVIIQSDHWKFEILSRFIDVD